MRRQLQWWISFALCQRQRDSVTCGGIKVLFGNRADQVAIRSVIIVSKVMVHIQYGLDFVTSSRCGAECRGIGDVIWIEIDPRLRRKVTDLLCRYPNGVSVRPKAGRKFVRRCRLIGHHDNQPPGKWLS